MPQDLCIENKNIDLPLLPPIHTAAGYQRQGSMLGPCIRCKQFQVGMKSSGDLGQRKVHQAGTGSKNNQTPEKKLIYEVATLFLGSDVGMQPRAPNMNSFSVLRSQITIRGKLDRQHLPMRCMERQTTTHMWPEEQYKKHILVFNTR